MCLAYAAHEIVSDYTTAALMWFETGCGCCRSCCCRPACAGQVLPAGLQDAAKTCCCRWQQCCLHMRQLCSSSLQRLPHNCSTDTQTVFLFTLLLL
jgi:hypothetical protein